jgi:ribose transport system ATP-binding protein
VALDDVSLDVEEGELMAICGENGAGKSTLLKILAGAISKTSGTISFQGKKVDINNPHDAKRFGISIIYQELNLNPNLNIAENILLGQEPAKGGFINRKDMYEKAGQICNQLNIHYDLRTKVGRLSIAQMQMVEIAKAISWNARLLIMDEPTASLTTVEIDALFNTIKVLKAQGVTIIYISHRLEEVFQIADRVTVFRDGKLIKTVGIGEIDKFGLVKMMVGREIGTVKHVYSEHGDLVLEVKNLTVGDRVKDVSFQAYKNEILGFSGLVGAGRTELMRAIFGADKADSGEIWLYGKKVRIKNIRSAIKNGIALMPEDRKSAGLVLLLDICKNITLTNIGSVIRALFISRKIESRVAGDYVKKLSIKTPSVYQQAKNLSGGNQQKVVLAKWLFAKPRVLIFDEPTRGIDIGAKAEIYELMKNLVADGICVIVISSELPEILQICDRIIVMHEGRMTAEIMGSEATQEGILSYSTGIEA